MKAARHNLTQILPLVNKIHLLELLNLLLQHSKPSKVPNNLVLQALYQMYGITLKQDYKKLKAVRYVKLVEDLYIGKTIPWGVKSHKMKFLQIQETST